jgi:lysophospholipase L1-like esterase
MRLGISHHTAASPPARSRLRALAPRVAVTLTATPLLVASFAGAAGATRQIGASGAAGQIGASGAARQIGASGAAGVAHRAGVTSYVSLGDSYTSGPLIPDQTGSPAGCLRSSHNYPSLVAAATGATSFTDVSCAGADTTDMTNPQPVTLGTNPPQDDALSAATTLVTLQIGGNDINFSSIIEKCAELSLTNPFGSPCKKHYTSGGTDQLRAAVNATAPKVAADLQGIHADAPSARVLVVGYPAILPNTGNGCWPVVPVAYGDVPYLRGVEKELNAMLTAVAAANGASYVNTYTASIGHDACQSPGTKWVEGLVPTSPAAPFHPNARGERGMARQVLRVLG